MIPIDIQVRKIYPSLKIEVSRPGFEPRIRCPASPELNHSTTAVP